MKGINKVIIVLLALILTYVSVNVGSYGDNLNFSSRIINPNSSEYYFESKVNPFIIQRTQENFTNLIENFFAQSNKKIITLISDRNQLIEQILFHSTYSYIRSSSNIDLSGAIRILIYPFNYFW